MEDKAAKAQADASRRQATEFRRQAGLVGAQSQEVVKQYTSQAKGAMGDWIMARSAAGMLDFADPSKDAKAIEEITGIKTEFDNPAKEAEFLTGAKSELADLLKKKDSLTPEAAVSDAAESFSAGSANKNAARIKELQDLIAGTGGNATPAATIEPLDQMKLASGSDLLSGVTFSRQLEYDRSMLVRKGQEDAYSMWQSGANADAQASYYEQASKTAGAGNLFKTILGGAMMAGSLLAAGPTGGLSLVSGPGQVGWGMMFGGASTAAGGLFG